jgi:acetyl esterase/lipase
MAAELRREPGEHGEWWWVDRTNRRLPTVVLVHGGYWRKKYDRHLEDPLAADLAAQGFLVWNIDYAPAAAGWPATLRTAAAAYDELASSPHARMVDRDRIALVGHSAGGHLAIWLASRPRLPSNAPGALVARESWVAPVLVVAQAPVAALVQAARQRLGGGAVAALCGGGPDEVPDRYAVADPAALVPAAAPVVLLHGVDDGPVPISQSEAYLDAALAAGADVELEAHPGGHFEHLDPGSEAVERLHWRLAPLLVN